MKKTVKEVVSEKIEEKVTEAKKSTKNPVVKKPVVKKPASTKKAAVRETVYLQYLGKEINKDDVMKRVKEVWTKQMKKKVGDLISVDLYLKPEENAVYYVINGEVTGSLEI